MSSFACGPRHKMATAGQQSNMLVIPIGDSVFFSAFRQVLLFPTKQTTLNEYPKAFADGAKPRHAKDGVDRSQFSKFRKLAPTLFCYAQATYAALLVPIFCTVLLLTVRSSGTRRSELRQTSI